MFPPEYFPLETVILSTCEMSAKDGFEMCVSLSKDLDLVTGDYIRLEAYHDNAATKNLLNGTSSFFEIRRLF